MADLNKELQKAKEAIEKAKEQYNNTLKEYNPQVVELPLSEDKVTVEIYSETGNLPEYKTLGASGMDLRAMLDTPKEIQPLERVIIPTGVFVNLPTNYEIQLRPRSGLSYKKGLTLVNCIGTIDEDYVQEIGVLIINLSNEVQTIQPNDRICQMVLAKVDKIEWKKVEDKSHFDSKDRTGGLGSTGVK